jgi:Tol biopolymer transport system component
MVKIKTVNFFNLKILIIVIIPLILIEACNDEINQPDYNQVASYTQIDFEPSVTNDNSKMVYVHSNIDFELSGIYIFDLSANTSSFFLNGFIRTPDWSPDSQWIVYSLGSSLYKIKSNGDSVTLLTNFGNNLYPKWSDDGSKIAFANTDFIEGNSGVYVINTDGTSVSLIEGNASFPEWQDSGNILLFLKTIKNPGGQPTGDSLFRISLNNNQKEFITTFSGSDHILNSYLNVSGSDVIFCSTSETGYSYVYKYSLTNGTLTKLTSTQGWSPYASDFSDKIYYTNRNLGNGRLWIMNNDGSDPVSLKY